jgi:predicted alpha/beta hydrolase family esterase
MPRVLIVPGLRNSGPGHWQTEWQRHLRHVRRIDVADWSTPNLQAWTDAIDRAIDDFAPTHIVAHSFGTLASAAVAARRGDELRSLLLVAPADPDKFGIAAQLPQHELPVGGVLVGSLSDPWFGWENAQALGEQWGLQTVCAGDVGHINVQSGHGQWSQGWLILQRQLQQYAPTHQFLRERHSPQKFSQPKLRFAF